MEPIAEYQLNQLLHDVEANKTVIYISHRLSTTRFADRIYIMKNGKIIEAGNHEELLKMNGKYSEMWHAQAGQYLAE